MRVSTVHAQFRGIRRVSGRIAGLTSVISSVLVAHGADDQYARSRADIRRSNAQIVANVVTVKIPTNRQRFIAFRHGTRGLSK